MKVTPFLNHRKADACAASRSLAGEMPQRGKRSAIHMSKKM